MKVTKFVHSCLLVENQDKSVLIDPGLFSWESGLIKIDRLPRLDYLLITHEHPDHFHLPFIKAIFKVFPSVRIISNSSVVEKLLAEAISASTKTDGHIDMKVVQHETPPLGMPAPKNAIFTVSGRLTHPGDYLSMKKSAEILALPIVAPFGSFKWAMETALRLKPKTIIPIHDWHLSEAGKNSYYDRAAEALNDLGIDFIKIKDGEPVEV